LLIEVQACSLFTQFFHKNVDNNTGNTLMSNHGGHDRFVKTLPMLHLNKLSSCDFFWLEKLHQINYFCTKEAVNENKMAFNQVWLVIDWEKTIIKILKPETILRQPREVIEKIVEREVKQYLANEVIEQL
jgi:hypothetical protein